uniref:Uncharacterized protein n=1 Tax=Lepeophtheirus salmonis TaxID=72036 RepID=A0A0K2TEB2_LEPSM
MAKRPWGMKKRYCHYCSSYYDEDYRHYTQEMDPDNADRNPQWIPQREIAHYNSKDWIHTMTLPL